MVVIPDQTVPITLEILDTLFFTTSPCPQFYAKLPTH